MTAVTLPEVRYLRAAGAAALKSAAPAWVAAKGSTGQCTFTAWAESCAGCDRLEPGFAASPTRQGFGLAELVRVSTCRRCGSAMKRGAVTSMAFAVDGPSLRAALGRVLTAHSRVLARWFALAAVEAGGLNPP